MINKTKWTIGFLGVTAIAILMELIAAFDNSENTIPWTSYIVDNIPAFIGFPLIALFAAWLVRHFYSYYYPKK